MTEQFTKEMDFLAKSYAKRIGIVTVQAGRRVVTGGETQSIEPINNALRQDISYMLSQKHTVAEIADSLGRPKSVIYSQIKRMGIKLKRDNC